MRTARGTVRRFSAFGLAVLVVGAFTLTTALPGGATVSAKNSKFCKAVANIGQDAANSPDSFTKDEAKAFAKSVKKAVKKAPKKVGKALTAMSKYFTALADAGSNPDKVAAAARFAKNYTKSVTTFISYYTKNCLGDFTPGT